MNFKRLKEFIKLHTTARQRGVLKGVFSFQVYLFNFYIFFQSFNWKIQKYLWKRDYSPLFIKFPLKSFEEVYKYYLMASQKLGQGTVLKVDLFNEAKSMPQKGGIIGSLNAESVYGIELDESIKNEAERELSSIACHLSVGDIRKLPYEDKKFDTVIDLSTIDHVDPADLGKVFGEYARVMKDGGLLFLVVWISNNKESLEGSDYSNGSGKQYFFNHDYFLAKLRKDFIIEREDTIFNYQAGNVDGKLVRFICRENKVWSYLLSDEVDYRVWLAAGYLKDRIENKIIVDLNCGHAPLLKYIPHTFKKYLGNDIRNIFPKSGGNCEFKLMDDASFIQKLSHIDILVIFGLGGYEISRTTLESDTITQSVKDCITRFSPEIVILESVQKYSSLLREIEDFSNNFSYNTKQALSIYSNKKDAIWLKDRTVIIIEKEPSVPKRID